ncbi:MAG: glycosyl transferase family 2 [Clostridia bacterium]|nr:glycosyl transferase family 2 [Clostridia bacterium]
MSDTRLKEVLFNKEENYMLPFYWQHGDHRERIPEQVQRIYDSGCRALCVESRPHPDFCGPDWWADMDIILSESKKRGMKVWILDDKHFPTGRANGLIAEKYPEHRRWTIRSRHVDVIGPIDKASFLLEDLDEGEILEGVYAYPRTGVDEEIAPEPIDLTSNAKNGYVYWDVPAGCYRVFFIVRSQKHAKPDYMDMIRDDACHVLIEAVYEPHYEHYSEYFGNTIAGFFSDEPQFGNLMAGRTPFDFGMYEHRVGDPGMSYPYNDELLSLMSEEMGEDAKPYLGELWYYSDHAPKTRLAYMNAVTRLWRRCFSRQLGDWCRDHGVMYIGHIIEDKNAHGRLTCSAGHYFRALEGQDMSGIDVVLHQVMPGMAHYKHNCYAATGSSDPEFFHYVLAQLAASMSHQYPHMKGRAMCEEFGAYGWAEGSTMMKWMSDFLLVRGINHFVPHAFSPEYPDRDCPPHFGAEGHDPQFDGFTHLMKYTNKASHLLYGGPRVTSCGILYHAEGEWMNRRGDAMLTQVPAKVLLDAHLCYGIVCVDALKNATVENGKITVGDEVYGALVIPYAPILPPELLAVLEKFERDGLPILLCDRRPTDCVGEVVGVDSLPARIKELGLADIKVDGNCPLLRHYHVKRDGADVFMFFNEDNVNTAKATVTLPVKGDFARLRLIEDEAYGDTANNGTVSVELLPGQSEILVFGDASAISGLDKKSVFTEEKILTPTYKIEIADSDDLDKFTEYRTTDKLFSITAPDELPHFSGKVKYTFTLYLDSVSKPMALDLGYVGQTARIWVNGKDAGIRITAPYTYQISELLRSGENIIEVEVANTLVGKTPDKFSLQMVIPPSGLLGPVSLKK